METIKKGIYKHYKGKKYEVLDLVIHSETLEKLVLYKPLYKTKEPYNGRLWVRPLDMFMEELIIDGKAVKRFEYLS